MRFNLSVLFFPLRAVIPRLQCDKEKGVVTGSDEAEQAETDDAGGVLHTGCVGQHLLDFPYGLVRPLERGSVWKLEIDEDIALIFIGQETRWHPATDETGGCEERCQYHQRERGLANQEAGEANVAVGGALENAVEAIEEPTQQASTLLSWPEQEGGKGGAEGEGVERRENYRYRDGHSKLLVKAAGNSRDKSRRYKDGGEHQGDTD